MLIRVIFFCSRYVVQIRTSSTDWKEISRKCDSRSINSLRVIRSDGYKNTRCSWRYRVTTISTETPRMDRPPIRENTRAEGIPGLFSNTWRSLAGAPLVPFPFERRTSGTRYTTRIDYVFLGGLELMRERQWLTWIPTADRRGKGEGRRRPSKSRVIGTNASKCCQVYA